MTRNEAASLKDIRNDLYTYGDMPVTGPAAVRSAIRRMDTLIRAAEHEFALEDRHHDLAEADAYPVNLEQAA